MSMTQYRQGDVWIERIDPGAVPADLERVRPDGRKRIVLAEGQATGHAHTLPARSVRTARRDPSGVLYLDVKAFAKVTHDEHDPIALEPGVYRVRRQREYHPEAIRNVAD